MVVIPFYAFAKAVVYSFEEIIQESELIVVCELKRVEQNLFSLNLAHVAVIETLKGDQKIKNVKVPYGNRMFNTDRYRKMFQKGRKYILFLNYHENQYWLTGHLGGHYEISSDGKVCDVDGKIPFDIFIDEVLAVINEGRNTEPSASPDTRGLAAPGAR